MRNRRMLSGFRGRTIANEQNGLCPRQGFTLIEAMLSLMILGITVSGTAVLLNNGLLSLQESEELLQVQSAARSQLETLISRPFGDVLAEGSGGRVISLDKRTYDLAWTATNHDMDGDGFVETDAMLLKVSAGGSTLRMIVVDHGDDLGVLP